MVLLDTGKTVALVHVGFGLVRFRGWWFRRESHH
jgi:hypothetical protein